MKAAKTLNLRSDEASKRSATGRAYYAAFGVARTAIESANDADLDSGRVHQDVWNLYNLIDQVEATDLSEDGWRLRELRRIADYEPECFNPEEQAKLGLERAQRVLDKVPAVEHEKLSKLIETHPGYFTPRKKSESE